MSQRNIKEKDVQVAMQYGEEIHRTGIVFFFLGRKNLPAIMQEILDYLEGTTVLFDPDTAEIITVYRNPEGLRDIKRKAKYAMPKQLLRQI